MKPCPNCNRTIYRIRTLIGPMIKGGSFEVWVHLDTNYAPCNVDAEGREVPIVVLKPSRLISLDEE